MTIEAMKQALEFFDALHDIGLLGADGEPIRTALRTAIEQAEKQEPVTWMYKDKYGNLNPSSSPTVPPDSFPVYTTPPAQPAQEEIQRLTALVRAQQITIDKLEAAQPAPVQEPVASAWMHNGKMVNAFPWSPSDPRAADKNGYWRDKGYTTQPLYTTPPAAHVQEPVGEAYLCDKCQTPFDGAWECPSCGNGTATREPVYTHPAPSAQRQWVGLKPEERRACEREADLAYIALRDDEMRPSWASLYYRAIEAKLREKNGGQA